MALLTKALSSTDTVVTSTDDTNFPNGSGSFAPFLPTNGQIQIDSEIISYTSHYHDEFRGLTRGASGTIAAAHLIGAQVNPLAVQE
jgi:hypothetical protein